MKEFKYCGEELDVFEGAINWKDYWVRKIQPFVGRKILEIGAGIGATTVALKDVTYDYWVSIEPDISLCEKIEQKKSKGEIKDDVEVKTCAIAQLDNVRKFDTILYIDVLEHIENDIEELKIASGLLNDGGKIIVLSPAHNFLFSEFDRKIGHYRRYNKSQLIEVVPPRMKMKHIQYMDSVGLCASLANKLILKQSDPTRAQIAFWDKTMVPLSRVLDPIFLNRVGKSILAVLQKETNQ